MIDINLTQDPSTGGFPWSDLLALAPHALWAAVFLSILLFVIGPKTVREAFSRATKIGIAGFEIELKSELEAAAKAHGTALTDVERDRLLRRISRSEQLIRGARVLWIDDAMENNKNEITLLRELGASIDLADDDAKATERLASAVYDVVLSDMKRGEVDDAGAKFLPSVTAARTSPPLIFYVLAERDTPKGAFALATRPDELLHRVLDALERRRG